MQLLSALFEQGSKFFASFFFVVRHYLFVFQSNFCSQWLFLRSLYFHCFLSPLKCCLQNEIIKQMSIISGFICSHKQQSKCLYEGKPNWTVINNPKFTQQDKLLKSEWPKLKSVLNLEKLSKMNVTCNPVSFWKLCTTFNWICNEQFYSHTHIFKHSCKTTHN